MNIQRHGKISIIFPIFLAMIMILGSGFANGSKVSAYTEADADLLYVTEKVTTKAIPIKEKDTGKSITKPIKFKIWNATLQEFVGEVTTKDGMLPPVQLTKGQHYIFYAEDKEYITYNGTKQGINIYMVQKNDGEFPYNDRKTPKGAERISVIEVIKRNYIEKHPEDVKRVAFQIPLLPEGSDVDDYGNAKVELTSEYETIIAPVIHGAIDVKLIEDMNYMVRMIDSDEYSIDPFPMTVKDHSEDGRFKWTYMHLSCSGIQVIPVIDKSDEHKNDNTLTSSSKKVSLSGMNFRHGNYIVKERILNMDIPSLEGKDYEVLDIDTINLYRCELSKLAKGDFKVTYQIPEGKTINKVYYIDKAGALKEVKVVQNGNKITFDMPAIGLYNNVILYKNMEKVHKIKFDANGGKVDIDSAETEDDGTLKSLPKATLDGKEFVGWYTEKDGGKKIGTKTVFDKDETVYAHFADKGEESKNFKDVSGNEFSFKNGVYQGMKLEKKARPYQLTVTAKPGRKMLVEWTNCKKLGADIDGYIVTRKVGSSKVFSEYKRIPANTNYLVDILTKKDANYYYMVFGYKKDAKGNLTISENSMSAVGQRIDSKKINPYAPKLNYTKKTIRQGESVQLKLTYPKNSISTWTRWRTHNDAVKVAKVNQQGVVTGMNKGEVLVSARTPNGRDIRCLITVK